MFGLKRLFQRTPTKQDFAQKAIRRLQEARPGTEFTYDEGMFHVRFDGQSIINLQNVYLDYCQVGKMQRAAVLEQFIQGMLQPNAPESFEEVRAALLPVVRAVAGLDMSRILAGMSKRDEDLFVEFAMRPLVEGLGIGIAVDSETAIQQVGRKHIEAWGKTLEEVLAIATDNLRHKSAPRFEEALPGLYVSHYGDFYDAARILLPELAWQLPLNGAPVAMIPNRTCMLLAGDRDEGTLIRMIELSAKMLFEDSRPLTAEMFRLEGRAFGPWRPDGKAGGALHELQMQLLANDYAAQKDALEEDIRKRGEEVFVATFTLVKKGDEAPLESYSVLSAGIHSWLPKTDLVAVLDDQGENPIMTSWELLSQVAGTRLEHVGHVPPRYRLLGGLSELDRRQLQEDSVSSGEASTQCLLSAACSP